MPVDGKPEIAGPGAHEIEAVPDATGHSGDPTVVFEEEPETLAEPEPQIDPAFPFGRPENIDYTKIDQVGVKLIQEVNLRPWIKSTEYCSGHPLDRPADEYSEIYPYVTGENVYKEINKLDLAYVRGLIPDVFFRHRKAEIREMGATRFYLNVNVYNLGIFLEWARLFGTFVVMATNSTINPLIVRYNPLRVGMNYSIYWDYWTAEERELIHTIALDSLSNFPV